MSSLEIVELKAKLLAPLKIVKEAIERFLPLPSKIKQMSLYVHKIKAAGAHTHPDFLG